MAAGALGGLDASLHLQVTAGHFVMSIFFISGVSMKTETMWGTITDYRMHAFIQGFALLVVPVLVRLLLLPLLAFCGLHPSLLKGFMVVGCMPPPVSTSVILTKTAGGNEAAAIFNSALGSFLGVIVTPIELLLLVDPSGTLPVLAGSSLACRRRRRRRRCFRRVVVAAACSVVRGAPGPDLAELSFTVVLPLIVGQRRPRLGAVVDRHKPQLSNPSSFTLLVIIYTTFATPSAAGAAVVAVAAGAASWTLTSITAADSSGRLNLPRTTAAAAAAPATVLQQRDDRGLVFTGVVVRCCSCASWPSCSASRARGASPPVAPELLQARRRRRRLQRRAQEPHSGRARAQGGLPTSPILPLLSTPSSCTTPCRLSWGARRALIKTCSRRTRTSTSEGSSHDIVVFFIVLLLVLLVLFAAAAAAAYGGFAAAAGVDLTAAYSDQPKEAAVTQEAPQERIHTATTYTTSL